MFAYPSYGYGTSSLFSLISTFCFIHYAVVYTPDELAFHDHSDTSQLYVQPQRVLQQLLSLLDSLALVGIMAYCTAYIIVFTLSLHHFIKMFPI